MFVCNLLASRQIIESICAMREYRKNRILPVPSKESDVSCKICMFSTLFIIGMAFIPLIYGLIGCSCFRNKFTSMYYHHVLMACMLAILWAINTVIMIICIPLYNSLRNQTDATNREPKVYEERECLIFGCSDRYKKIDIKHKTFFALSVVILHLVSVYIFDGVNTYDTNTQNYINAIFWIGHFIDALNLIVLFYDDCADITIIVLTFCSWVNDLIIGIILSLTVSLSYHVIGALILSNSIVVGILVLVSVFVGVRFGLHIGHFVLDALLWGCVVLYGLLGCFIVLTIPFTLWTIAVICIVMVWGLSYSLGCSNGEYFENLIVECDQLCKPFIDFACKIIDGCCAFLDYVFGIESVPVTNDSYQNMDLNVNVEGSVNKPELMCGLSNDSVDKNVQESHV